MKRIVALVLALCMLFALTACGGKTEAPAEPAETAAETEASGAAQAESPDAETAEDSYIGKTLVVALDEEPAALIPQSGTPTAAVQVIAATIFPYLRDYDENGEEKNNLLDHYEWVDETTCKLYLREGVLAADGTPYTASDVIYSFRLGLEGSSPSTYSDLNTEEWTAEDDYTVVCKFKNAYPLFTTIFANDYAAILSESVMTSLGGMESASLNPAVGGGYYNFVEWVSGQYILLEYNEDYWDESYKPAYQYIKLLFIPDSASRGLAVQSGDADVAIDVGLSNTLAYEGVSGVKVNAIDEPSVTMMWLNCGSEYLSNQKVREALGYLIDFDSLNDIFSGGLATKTQTAIPPSSPFFADTEYTLTYDPEKGKELLKEAGYENGFDLFLFSEPTEGYSDACELVQYYLSEAGINVTIEYANQTNYFDTVQGYKYDILLTAITTSMINFMAAYYNNGEDAPIKCGGPNCSDEELIGYSKTLSTTFDEQERMDAFVAIQKMTIDQSLSYGICCATGYHLSGESITGFAPGAAGQVLIQYLK